MGGGTQRKAWNEAMKSAGAGILVNTNSTSSLARRSSDRRRSKQSRRDKARKSTQQQFDSSEDQREYLAAVRIDALEDVVDGGAAEEDEEEDFELLDDDDDSTGGSGSGGGGGRSSRRSRSGSSGGGGASSSSSAAGKRSRSSAASASSDVPKRHRPRTLASILVEDAGRMDGMTKQYLHAEARRPPGARVRPVPKLCPATGLLGVYTDPKSGIPYANLAALEQIRERAPPWMSLGGSTAYSEAMKSLRAEWGGPDG